MVCTKWYCLTHSFSSLSSSWLWHVRFIHLPISGLCWLHFFSKSICLILSLRFGYSLSNLLHHDCTHCMPLNFFFSHFDKLPSLNVASSLALVTLPNLGYSHKLSPFRRSLFIFPLSLVQWAIRLPPTYMYHFSLDLILVMPFI